jgi:hypothetical protein
LESKGNGALKPNVLRWGRQRPFEGKKALRKQRLFESKESSKAKTKAILRQNALRMQRPYDDKGKRRPKAKCELYDCNKQTSSFLAITPVLVRLGRRCCVTGESVGNFRGALFERKKGTLKIKHVIILASTQKVFRTYRNFFRK